MAELTPAVPSILPSVTSGQVAGSVATPKFPGPITTDHSGGPESYSPGSPSGPPQGQAATVPYFELPPVPQDIPGELGDYSAIYGHAAPVAAFDSNAGEPFAGGSGPIAMEVHQFDTGGTRRTQHVPEPRAKGWWRRTLTGQTWNRTVTYDPTGKIVSAPNDRTDMDQYQGQNADAYAPFWIPYAERPIKLNIANAPVAVQSDETTAYTPAVGPSAVGPQFWTDQSVVYEAPPDPQTTTVSGSQAPSAAVGFWS